MGIQNRAARASSRRLKPPRDSLKTAHWAVFLARIDLIGSNPPCCCRKTKQARFPVPVGIRTGGEVGIRTPDTLVGYTHLAGEHLRPLGHFSARDAHFARAGVYDTVTPIQMQGRLDDFIAESPQSFAKTRCAHLHFAIPHCRDRCGCHARMHALARVRQIVHMPKRHDRCPSERRRLA